MPIRETAELTAISGSWRRNFVAERRLIIARHFQRRVCGTKRAPCPGGTPDPACATEADGRKPESSRL